MLTDPLSQLLDGDERDAVLLAEREALLQPHHLAVLAHELSDGRHRVLAGEAAHVVGGLRVAAPLQHASRTGAEGEHVARLGEVLRLALGPAEGPHGLAPVSRRHPRRGRRQVVRGHIEGRRVLVRVVVGSRVQAELLELRLVGDKAHDACGVLDHEGHLLLGQGLPEDNQVALVFPVEVVHDEDEVALGVRGDSLRDDMRAVLEELPRQPLRHGAGGPAEAVVAS
mmetsp:Transcript_4066/g.11762  ORF Transcript_4066/g.11762 Transcript_4066/m.11762 type:complete len:226 (+) Transcript_4066:1212-1889(+)